MTCEELRDAASELALGVLTGTERAAALAHLEMCHSCRAEVASLTATADEILLLAPSAQPSAGFESRVLDRIVVASPVADVQPAATGRPRRGGARLVAVAAVIAAVVALSVARWLINDDSTVAAAEMRTRNGDVVGHAYLHDGDPAAVEVAVPGWVGLASRWGEPTGGTYWFAIELDDGTRDLIAFPLESGASWRTEIEVDTADIASVAIVDSKGRTWCSGRFD